MFAFSTSNPKAISKMFRTTIISHGVMCVQCAVDNRQRNGRIRRLLHQIYPVSTVPMRNGEFQCKDSLFVRRMFIIICVSLSSVNHFARFVWYQVIFFSWNLLLAFWNILRTRGAAACMTYCTHAVLKWTSATKGRVLKVTSKFVGQQCATSATSTGRVMTAYILNISRCPPVKRFTLKPCQWHTVSLWHFKM